jgi:hypothetical protein
MLLGSALSYSPSAISDRLWQFDHHRCRHLYDAASETHHTAHPAPYQRHAPARQQRRHRDDSRCGSATRRPKQRTSTSTPTPPSRNEQSHEPPHSEPSRADTTHPTNSWRSSKRCDYVEHLICQTLRCKGNRSRQVSIQHNRAWDIQPAVPAFQATGSSKPA